MSSAAVVIGALRVKVDLKGYVLKCRNISVAKYECGVAKIVSVSDGQNQVPLLKSDVFLHMSPLKQYQKDEACSKK